MWQEHCKLYMRKLEWNNRAGLKWSLPNSSLNILRLNILWLISNTWYQCLTSNDARSQHWIFDVWLQYISHLQTGHCCSPRKHPGMPGSCRSTENAYKDTNYSSQMSLQLFPRSAIPACLVLGIPHRSRWRWGPLEAVVGGLHKHPWQNGKSHPGIRQIWPTGWNLVTPVEQDTWHFGVCVFLKKEISVK